jgi:hypothetical protein
VTLKCRCIDRIFLQAYVPKMQTVAPSSILEFSEFIRWGSPLFAGFRFRLVGAGARHLDAHRVMCPCPRLAQQPSVTVSEEAVSLKAEYGDRLWLAHLDVTDTSAIKAAVEKAFANLGRIDVVVNNAGCGLFGAAESLTDEQIIHQVSSEGKVLYRPASRKGGAAFSCRFERAVELIGSMRLKLWVSTSEGDDLDLFVVLRKLDAAGREVFFSGYHGYEHDGFAKDGCEFHSGRSTHRAARRSVHGTAILAFRSFVPATLCHWKLKFGRLRHSSRLEPPCC